MEPAVAAGHSLGEYSALVAAGAISFADAVKTVHLRGRFMQEAVPLGEGGMAAIIGLTPDKIVEVCQSVSTDDAPVQAVNFNCPGQVVIAGATKELKSLRSSEGSRCPPCDHASCECSLPFHPHGTGSRQTEGSS